MYLLLAYIKFSAKLGWSMQAMLRLLQLNLFMRRDLLGCYGVIHRSDIP